MSNRHRFAKTGMAVRDCPHKADGCEWRLNSRFLSEHLIRAHGHLDRNNRVRSLNRVGLGFFITKQPPSFEECLRLSDRRFDFYFDVAETGATNSMKLKAHYRDIVRGFGRL